MATPEQHEALVRALVRGHGDVYMHEAEFHTTIQKMVVLLMDTVDEMATVARTRLVNTLAEVKKAESSTESIPLCRRCLKPSRYGDHRVCP